MSFFRNIGSVPALAFTGFVFWLVAFPMSGDLLALPDGLLWFLLPHTVALLLLGRWGDPALSKPVTVTACLFTIMLTILFPWLPGHARLLLVLLGLTAAPVSLRAGTGLKDSESFAIAALFGLVAGNLFAILLAKLPLHGMFKFLLIGIFLAPVLYTPCKAIRMRGEIPGFIHYISFIFAFQLVSGLMYGYLFPAYAEYGMWPGVELMFYMGGATVSATMLKYGRDLTLAAGVMLAMLAFSLLLGGNSTLTINLSMFTMMSGAGVIDLFLIVFVLSFDNAGKAYGYGMGVLCGGIAAGRILSAWVGDVAHTMGFLGSMFLNVAVLSLFFIEYLRRKQKIQLPTLDGSSTVETTELPAWLALLLSDRERTVLAGVLRNKIYREIADEMDISESSVKTYMNRIYFKSGIVGKKRLVDRLCRHKNDTA